MRILNAITHSTKRVVSVLNLLTTVIKSPVVNRAIFIYSLAAIDELTTLDGINHFHIAHNKPRLSSPSPEKKHTLPKRCLQFLLNRL